MHAQELREGLRGSVLNGLSQQVLEILDVEGSEFAGEVILSHVRWKLLKLGLLVVGFRGCLDIS